MNTLTLTEQTVDVVKPLFAQAREIYENVLATEKLFRRTSETLQVLAFHLGTVLVEMKAKIGHGKWLFWLEGSWPQLGERNAQRCMKLVYDNPEAVRKFESKGIKAINFSDFTAESIRKFGFGYVPVKEKLQLEGDEGVNPHPHYLTFINQYSKWRRQTKIGHAELPELDLMRRDFEPVVRDMIDLLGRDWFITLVA